MIEFRKNAIFSSIFIVSITIALSAFCDIAYIYTLCGLSAWAAFGHLITLDDDMPGEWSNPEGDKALWRNSLAAMAIKFMIFITLAVTLLSFPSLAQYGG